MSKTITVVIVIVALLGTLLVAGCQKKEQTQLQGAPPATPPGTHVMPDGQTMGNADMSKMSDSAKTAPAKPAETAAAGTKDLATCPVLGTTMPKEKMIPYEYKGKTYYFCCAPCVDSFKKNPEKYITNPAKPKPPSEGM